MRKIAIDLSVFLLTRLVIYFLLATLAWYFGKVVFTGGGMTAFPVSERNL